MVGGIGLTGTWCMPRLNHRTLYTGERSEQKEEDEMVGMNAHVFLIKGLSVEELVKLDNPRGNESDLVYIE